MYLVFDVGGTSVKYAWMTETGEITERGNMRTRTEAGEGISEFVEDIGTVYDSYKHKGQIEGIAVDLPGQVDVENGIVYGGGALRYMHKVPLQELLMKRCDGVRVALENDGKCAALAEVWLGNARDVKDACILVFGTGIGGAIIKDRRVHHGKRMQAGEVSFMIDELRREDISKIGRIESMDIFEAVEKTPYFWAAHAATGALCFWMAKAKGLPLEEVTGQKIYEWARQGDELAQDMLEEMYFSIAKKCCNLFVTFDPEVILIGGGISAEPAFIEGIRRYVEQLKPISLVYEQIRIDVCKFRNDSNLLGALYNFKQKYGLLEE